MGDTPSTSKFFNLFKKSVEKTVEIKNAVSEQYLKITKAPQIVEFEEFYNQHHEHIERISSFSKGTMNSVQNVLAAQKRTPISYIHCLDDIHTHYKRNFCVEKAQPAWWTKHVENVNWVFAGTYYHDLAKYIEEDNKDKIVIEPLPEIRKKGTIIDPPPETRERVFLGDGFHLKFYLEKDLAYSKKGAAKARALIGKAFWKKNGNTIEFSYNAERNAIDVVAPPGEDFIPTEKTDQIFQHLEKFLKKGINRSCLFYGPPGTGKSNIVKGIAAKLDQTVMRVNFCDIAYMNSFLTEWLSICKPDILIIEDIDHAGDGGAKALATLERMNKCCKLLLATANEVSKLNDAVIRPGRFDELIEINKMDEQILLKIVGGDREILELVREFPIASIMELMKRVDALGRDEAIGSIEDIRKRFENMSDCDL